MRCGGAWSISGGEAESGLTANEAEMREMVWGHLGCGAWTWQAIPALWGNRKETGGKEGLEDFHYCYEWEAFLVPFKVIAARLQ